MNEQNSSGGSINKFASGLGERISDVAKLHGTRINAAKVAGISTDTLARYIREAMKPSFEPLFRMAYPKNVSLTWIANGEGDMHIHERGTELEKAKEPLLHEYSTDKNKMLILDTRLIDINCSIDEAMDELNTKFSNSTPELSNELDIQANNIKRDLRRAEKTLDELMDIHNVEIRLQRDKPIK
jgi:hypothetical protein